MAEPPPRDEMDMLAAEYVLGVLDAEERADTRALIDGNGTMRLLISQWEERLTPLNVAYPMEPAPDIWPALDAQFFAPGRKRKRLFFLAVAGLVVTLVVKLGFWLQLLH